MKASEIKAGDYFEHDSDGKLLYTVERVTPAQHVGRDVVQLDVRYVDGGNGRRYFAADDETPLQRAQS